MEIHENRLHITIPSFMLFCLLEYTDFNKFENDESAPPPRFETDVEYLISSPFSTSGTQTAQIHFIPRIARFLNAMAEGPRFVADLHKKPDR